MHTLVVMAVIIFLGMERQELTQVFCAVVAVAVVALVIRQTHQEPEEMAEQEEF
jgi:hypothetical protein